jgi:predicted glycosyltransferase
VREEYGLDGEFLLATVGGGGDGRPLLEAFIGAMHEFPGRPALVVTGEFMSDDDRAAVAAAAAAHRHVVVRRHVSELPSLMGAAELVVCMGGYNTSAEVLAVGARAVIVPRSWRSGEHDSRGRTGVDAEQLVRAEGLARTGAVSMLHPRDLAPAALAEVMRSALTRPRTAAAHGLSLDGAAVVAEQLTALAAGGRP